MHMAHVDNKWAMAALLAVGGLLVVFALQNMATIQVNFLGFGFETRRILLIIVSVLVGFALGKAIRIRRG